MVNGRERPGETVVASNIFFNLVTHHINLKHIKNLWVQCNRRMRVGERCGGGGGGGGGDVFTYLYIAASLL